MISEGIVMIPFSPFVVVSSGKTSKGRSPNAPLTFRSMNLRTRVRISMSSLGEMPNFLVGFLVSSRQQPTMDVRASGMFSPLLDSWGQGNCYTAVSKNIIATAVDKNIIKE